MDDLTKTIGISIITNGAVLGLFVWVFKKLFETSLLQRTKIFQSEIELINKKNFYQYGKVFDEQAKNISLIYADLVHLSDEAAYLAYHYNLLEEHPELFERYLIPKDGDPLKWDTYHKAVITEKHENVKAKELLEHASHSLREFRKKRIYFNRDVADEIERYMNLVIYVSSQFSNVTYRDPHDFKSIIADEVIETWIKAVNVSNKLFPILEDYFRMHLGVNEKIA